MICHTIKSFFYVYDNLKMKINMKGELMTGNKLNSYGRRKITCSLTEKELTADNIKFVLADILPIHIQNSQDIEKLEAVYFGLS